MLLQMYTHTSTLGIKGKIMNKTLKRAIKNSRMNSEYYTRKQKDKKQEVDKPIPKEDKK